MNGCGQCPQEVHVRKILIVQIIWEHPLHVEVEKSIKTAVEKMLKPINTRIWLIFEKEKLFLDCQRKTIKNQ